MIDFSGTSNKPEKTAEEKMEEDQAIQEIVPDLDLEEDGHLDLTLEEEGQFLQEYKTMLDSLWWWGGAVLGWGELSLVCGLSC